MRVIGYSCNQYGIINSDGESCSNPPFLEFLLAPKPDSVKVFWNLSYNIANLLKLIDLDKKDGVRLQKTTELFLPPYRIRYVPGKFFAVYKNLSVGFFNDASQYFKVTSEDYKKPTLVQAQEAQEVGTKVLKSLYDLGLKPKTITSPISVYQHDVLKKLDLPTVDDYPEEAGEYAYYCCKNNWVEVFKLGHFQKAYDFDLNSAYPSQIANLLDVRKGDWFKDKKGFHPNANYGYCKCRINIKEQFHPILMNIIRKDDSRNFTPIGEREEEFLNKRQIETIWQDGLGTCDIIDGWWFKANKLEYPLRQQIYWLYSQKLASSDDKYKLNNDKRIMAGIYGKFLQQLPESGEFGDWFNPVWAAEVECNNQIEVYRFCKDNNVIPISIAVDGVILDMFIDVGSSNELGKWRFNGEKEVISIGSGTVAIKGEKGEGDFALDYDWLVGEINKNPEATEYKVSKVSPVTLAVAINENKWNELGKLHDVTKTVDARYEEKRCYRRFPKNGGELLNNQFESEAWDTGTLLLENL